MLAVFIATVGALISSLHCRCASLPLNLLKLLLQPGFGVLVHCGVYQYRNMYLQCLTHDKSLKSELQPVPKEFNTELKFQIKQSYQLKNILTISLSFKTFQK